MVGVFRPFSNVLGFEPSIVNNRTYLSVIRRVPYTHCLGNPARPLPSPLRLCDWSGSSLRGGVLGRCEDPDVRQSTHSNDTDCRSSFECFSQLRICGRFGSCFVFVFVTTFRTFLTTLIGGILDHTLSDTECTTGV